MIIGAAIICFWTQSKPSWCFAHCNLTCMTINWLKYFWCLFWSIIFFFLYRFNLMSCDFKKKHERKAERELNKEMRKIVRFFVYRRQRPFNYTVRLYENVRRHELTNRISWCLVWINISFFFPFEMDTRAREKS